jgi:hypothetical protein
MTRLRRREAVQTRGRDSNGDDADVARTKRPLNAVRLGKIDVAALAREAASRCGSTASGTSQRREL